MGIPSISRSTNKKIPEYRDSEESDTFVLAGAEDLIPKFENNTGHWNEINKPYTENGIQYKVKEYRPRIEGLFAKIEKWTDDVGIVHWRTTSRDNIKTFYGFTEESRIFDPKHPTRIFQWCISHSYDDKGNLIIYNYKPEDFKNIPNHTFEKNKIGNCTNTYIKKIVYGNRTPYEIGDALPDEPDWQNEFMFHTQFDYGEHDLTNPKTVYDDYSSDWDYREDSFSNFRAAFELRTYRRCRRVLQFHCFSQLPIKHYLVKSMELLYNNSADMLSTDDTFNGFSFLTSVIQKGHKISNGGNSYLEKELPPMEFSYQQHEWNKEIKKVKKEDAENIPIGIDGSQYQWTDLFNEGISGILTEQNSIWNYKHNLSNGKFSASKPVAEKPSLRGLSSGDVQLRDIEGNGQKYLVSLNRGLPGHFLLDEEDSWHPMQTFDFLPNRNLTDPNARHIDVNGNGKTDLLISEDEVFLWYPSIGKKGYEEAIRIPKPRDEEDGPVCVFADSENTIFLADFTGDG